MKERRVYTPEFKREAVRLSEQTGVSVAQIARELGVSDYGLQGCRTQARSGGELAFPGNVEVALTAEQQENVRLKKELELAFHAVCAPFVLGKGFDGTLAGGESWPCYDQSHIPDVDQPCMLLPGDGVVAELQAQMGSSYRRTVVSRRLRLPLYRQLCHQGCVSRPVSKGGEACCFRPLLSRLRWMSPSPVSLESPYAYPTPESHA